MTAPLQNPVQLLADLVEALDRAYWSDWQSTATFADQWDAARQYIEKQKETPHD